VLDRILPVEDEDVSAFADKAFRKQGMVIKTETTVENLTTSDNSVSAALKSKDGKSETLTVDRVILAVGIVGNVEDIGLEQAGIRVEKTHVVVNQWGETGVPGIFAIGDLVGPPWLAHKAMHEGVIVAERIAGVKGVHPLDTSKVPGCTYCWPQVASIGLTEARAREGGRKIKVGTFPFSANGKAIALGEAEGFIKTVFDAETGELLGAHMIGAEVTELIQGFSIARSLEATEADLQAVVFPHPTLSEIMHEAVLAADSRPLHI
jgi:dihydrolipoamide dehydrogenase